MGAGRGTAQDSTEGRTSFRPFVEDSVVSKVGRVETIRDIYPAQMQIFRTLDSTLHVATHCRDGRGWGGKAVLVPWGDASQAMPHKYSLESQLPFDQ